DFAETISYCLLADVFKTRFGYKSLRDRELVQLTGRGIDAIGIEVEENGDIRLVLGETKLSDEAKSPPAVVDKGDDCLLLLSELSTLVYSQWGQAVTRFVVVEASLFVSEQATCFVVGDFGRCV